MTLKRKIVIASDHGGFILKKEIKNWLKKQGYKVQDLGTNNSKGVDYPVYAQKVAEAIGQELATEGILICSSGIGMSMAANRFPGVRAALCRTPKDAATTKKHNLANVLCLGAEETSSALAFQIVETWLKSETGKEERYQRRAALLDFLGRSHCSGCF